MIYIVSDVTSNAALAHRIIIDYRKECVSEWTDIRVYERIRLTRSTVLVFLNAVNAVERIHNLELFAQYAEEIVDL